MQSGQHAMTATIEQLLALVRDLTPRDRELALRAWLREYGDDDALGAQLRREMSERDRIEEALLESQRQLADAHHLLRRVLDAIPASVFWKDTELRYLGANQHFARDVGAETPDDLVGKTDHDLAFRSVAESHERDEQSVLDSGLPQIDHEESLTAPDGTVRWVRVSRVPLRNLSGNTIGVLGTFQDVTESRRFRDHLQQTQKLQAVGQLAGGVAHDFNNLLTGILGNAELISESSAEDVETSECAREIQRATRRAADLTQQLLAFSRQGRRQTENVDLHQLIRQTTKVLASTLQGHITVQHDLAATGAQVRGDSTQLGAVLLNLAANARDAMEAGGVLTITTRNCLISSPDESAPPREYLDIEVADTGKGIPQRIRGRIFEPFFTTKKPGEGTGLGLAAAFGIASDHDGTIHFESELGQGTTFTLRLPVVRGVPHRPTPAGVDLPHAARGHVLVVDDEEVVRNLTARVLRQRGYQVTTCVDGLEATAFFQGHHESVGLVILDLVMPRQNGEETLRQLLAIDPDAHILLASGYSREHSADALLAAGARGYLAKPFRIAVLLREVAQHLRTNH